MTIKEEKAKELGVKSGMYAKIIFDGNSNNTITINESLIVSRGQLYGVFTLSESNTALLRWVRLGKKVGNNYEVLSGLNVGDQIITSINNVQEGQRVEVI